MTSTALLPETALAYLIPADGASLEQTVGSPWDGGAARRLEGTRTGGQPWLPNKTASKGTNTGLTFFFSALDCALRLLGVGGRKTSGKAVSDRPLIFFTHSH